MSKTASGSRTRPLFPARRTVVVIHIGIRARVPPDLIKLCRHAFEETNILREGIPEAVEEILFRHEQIDAGDDRLRVRRGDGPDLPGNYTHELCSVLPFHPIEEHLGLPHHTAGRKRVVSGPQDACGGDDCAAPEHPRDNRSNDSDRSDPERIPSRIYAQAE
jgi:hypothetical protein